MLKKASFFLALAALSQGFYSCKNEPVACFSYDLPQDSLRVGREITFDAGCSNYGNSFAWDFGDSTLATTQVVKRSFASAGFRRIGVTVTGDDGSTTKYREINILP
jgi:PKD repeat protein